jgi:predicted ATPase
MLQKVNIQNFKSLKDITLDLQKVNLLIGPNNSGKSNFLKALEKFKLMSYNNLRNYDLEKIIKIDDFFGKVKKSEMLFTFVLENQENDFICNSELGIINSVYTDVSLVIDGSHWTKHEFWVDKLIGGVSQRLSVTDNKPVSKYFGDFFSDVEIYHPNPNKIIIPQNLESVKTLNNDCSNLIAFLFTLSIDDESAFQRIQNDFANCVIDFVRIKTPPINTDDGGKLSLKFFDKNGNDYWANEVSEGVLYFLALLCIVHQPNPPKLLLLEEPEKGIHPRRIKEVLDFIFQLADDKDIQVIMTTHSERVLDEFEDIPEAVFIFDKDEEGATQVKNLLKDVIEPSNQKMEAKGLPKIKFTDSLGSHWVTGFIGGVPR